MYSISRCKLCLESFYLYEGTGINETETMDVYETIDVETYLEVAVCNVESRERVLRKAHLPTPPTTKNQDHRPAINHQHRTQINIHHLHPPQRSAKSQQQQQQQQQQHRT